MLDLIVQADAEFLPLEDKSVDLVFTSPPYVDARWYGDKSKHSRQCVAWVDWMLRVVKEACRVCRGLVLVNCAGVTRKHRYQPAPEMLLSEWWKLGGECWRPAYWHRVGIPGSGGKQWLRADVEYVLAFKGEAGVLSVEVNNTACGHPPKWAPGGEMSYRLSKGTRVNQWGKNGSRKGMGARKASGVFGNCDRPSHINLTGNGGYRPDGSVKPRYFNGNQKMISRRSANGERDGKMIGMATDSTDPKVAAALLDMPLGSKFHTKATADGERVQVYTEPVKANPGNLVKVIVGGGAMGHVLAHENEAPFPLKLAEFFVKSFSPKGGTVLDMFGGSGTTAHAAAKNGRGFISMDIRANQCDLMRRRLFGDGLFARS